MASSLAGKIRKSTDSDEFDLANYDQARCNDLTKAAFSEPLQLQNMIRFTFIVGGGKLVRQKYPDELPKMFMSSLSAIGFQDDNGAVCEEHCGGKYKFQHDTGKNLKYVHVFPQIKPPQMVDQSTEAGLEAGDEKPPTPEEILFRSDTEEFTVLLAKHLPTYGQKKNLLDALKSRIAKLETIETKMIKLEQLDAEEQAVFDDVGADELREKAKAVTVELQKMVDEGRLTSREKTMLLEQLEAKLETLNAELSKAVAESKPKKVQMLKQQQELLQKNQSVVKNSDSAKLPPLKHGREIKELRGRLAEVLRIEKTSKGNYTMDELKRIGEKPEIEEAISVYETRSRGWLEEEEVFQERLQACLNAGGGSKKTSVSSNSGFSTVSGGGARSAKAKAAGPGTKNSFAALNS